MSQETLSRYSKPPTPPALSTPSALDLLSKRNDSNISGRSQLSGSSPKPPVPPSKGTSLSRISRTSNSSKPSMGGMSSISKNTDASVRDLSSSPSGGSSILDQLSSKYENKSSKMSASESVLDKLSSGNSPASRYSRNSGSPVSRYSRDSSSPSNRMSKSSANPSSSDEMSVLDRLTSSENKREVPSKSERGSPIDSSSSSPSRFSRKSPERESVLDRLSASSRKSYDDDLTDIDRLSRKESSSASSQKSSGSVLDRLSASSSKSPSRVVKYSSNPDDSVLSRLSNGQSPKASLEPKKEEDVVDEAIGNVSSYGGGFSLGDIFATPSPPAGAFSSAPSMGVSKKEMKNSLSGKSRRTGPLTEEKELLDDLGWKFNRVIKIANSPEAIICARTELQNDVMILFTPKQGAMNYEDGDVSLREISSDDFHPMKDLIRGQIERELLPHVGGFFHLASDAVVCFKDGDEMNCKYYTYSDRNLSSNEGKEEYPVPIVKYDLLKAIDGICTNVENTAHNLIFAHVSATGVKGGLAVKAIEGLSNELISDMHELQEKLRKMSARNGEWAITSSKLNEYRVTKKEAPSDLLDKKLEIQEEIIDIVHKYRLISKYRHAVDDLTREIHAKYAELTK